MSIISTFRDWLPDPHYPFKGGPFDGQRIAVRLHEHGDRGYGPPSYFRLLEPNHGPPEPVAKIGTFFDHQIPIHTYKFVPVDYWNSGYYEYVED